MGIKTRIHTSLNPFIPSSKHNDDKTLLISHCINNDLKFSAMEMIHIVPTTTDNGEIWENGKIEKKKKQNANNTNGYNISQLIIKK